MTENEKKLRDVVVFLREEDYPNTARNMDAALDALIAEHRAEVERLRAALAESGGAWRADVASARDAALEEAAQQLDGYASADAKRIRALTSRPASVVPVERVREELVRALNTAIVVNSDIPPEDIIREASRRLGIDLDATPERVAASQETPADPDACPRAKGVRHVWAPVSGGWRQCMECHKAVKVTP